MDLHLDFETKSEVDLKRHGIDRYASDPSTRALCLAYAFDDGQVEQWVAHEHGSLPYDLLCALEDPEVTKVAWNKSFEWNILRKVFGIDTPHHVWRDPMVLAFSLSLPGKLEKAGEILGLGEMFGKLSEGRALIRRFCVPRKPTKANPSRWWDHTSDPKRWAEFLAYNRQDVVAEREAERRMIRWNLPAHEWALWYLDQQINEAGLPIRMPLVHNAIAVSESLVSRKLREMAEITLLDNPNSGAQLLPWLKGRGYPYNDLVKGHVKRALESSDIGPDDELDDEEYREVLRLRAEVSRSSVKKYAALRDGVGEGDVLRNSLQFCGAGRTWRWAGRRYQAQNLARPARELKKVQHRCAHDLEVLDADCIELLYDKPLDLLSTCVRPVVQATPGNTLVSADLNAIENRVLGWLAGDEKILNVFAEGRDPYVDFATYMYGGTYEDLYAEYKAGNEEKRTNAKPAVLGCGYRLGPGKEIEDEATGEIIATGLLGYARNMGINLTLQQSELAVSIFRETYTGVVEFWGDIEAAAKRCVATKSATVCRALRFDLSGPFLRMHLPSGRALHYLRPMILPRMTPWGKVQPTLTYEGLDDKKNRWTRLTTHSGKLTENAVQAIARDILASGMTLADAAGLDIRLHIHDEIVTMHPEGRADVGLATLIRCMETVPSWAPGLPLAAAGSISRIFIKD